MATRNKEKQKGKSAKEAVMPEMFPDEVAFINVIAEAPDEDTPRLVYADWLDEHDRHARAEFIRVQCELARCPDRNNPPKGLREREWELLNEWGYQWLLELHVPSRDIKKRYQPGTAPRLRHALLGRHVLAGGAFRAPEFERGFVTSLSPDKTWFSARNRGWLGSPLLRLVSDIKTYKSGIRDMDIELFAASPNVSGVRRLMLWVNAIGDRGAEALATSPYLAGLTSLQLSVNRIGNAGAAALAHSDSLRGLTELCLASNRIGDPGAQAFLTTRLPALERLTLLNNPAISDQVASELTRHGGPAWELELNL